RRHTRSLRDWSSDVCSSDLSRGVDFGFDLFAEAIRVEGHEVFVTASIGVAEYPTHGSDADTLIRHAEMAMYYAKQNGRNRLEFRSEERRVGKECRLRWRSDT